MNILIMLAVAAAALCVLWAVQSIVLELVGEPLGLAIAITRKDRGGSVAPGI